MHFHDFVCLVAAYITSW